MLALGLLAYRRLLLPDADRRAQTALRVSLAALGLQIIADFLQFWVTDPTDPAEFESVPSTLGFYLEALSYLLSAVGLVMIGLAAVRGVSRPRWPALPLVTGLLVLPTVIFPSLGLAVGTRRWDIILTLSRSFPSLCLVVLDVLVMTGAAVISRAPGSASVPAAPH